jgi:transposase-like protein
MAKRTSQEREQFWRDLIGRQPASGLSIAQFCKQTGVSANSFFVWKRRLRPQIGRAGRPQATSRSRAPVRSTRSNGPAAAASSFVPVRLIADPVRHQAPTVAAIEVEWPNGLVLRVPVGCHADVVRDVVKVLVPLIAGDAPSC